MTCEKQAQKFHTEDVSLPRSWYCFLLVVPHGKFDSANQKNYPDLGSDASSVMEFVRSFLRRHLARKPVHGSVAKCQLFSQATY